MKLLRTFVLVAVFPLLTEAAVITTGSITITVPFSGNFSFIDPDVSVADGLFSNSRWDLVQTPIVGPGDLVSVTGTPSDGDFGIGGSVVVDGMRFPLVNWGSSILPVSMFNITGPDIQPSAGCIIPGFSTCGVTVPFTFSGSLCGVVPGGGSNTCMIDLPDLTGLGMVSAMYNLQPDGNLSFSSAIFVFSAVLWCVGSGERRRKFKHGIGGVTLPSSETTRPGA